MLAGRKREEPLLGSAPLTVRFESGESRLELTAATPGPAGVVECRLGSVELMLDAADPSSLVGLDVSGISQASDLHPMREMLVRMLGQRRWIMLTSMFDDGRLSPNEWVLEPSERRRRVREISPALARLVLNLHHSIRPGILPVELSVSTVEAARHAARIGLLDSIPDLREQRDYAVKRLAKTPDDEFSRLFDTRSDHPVATRPIPASPATSSKRALASSPPRSSSLFRSRPAKQKRRWRWRGGWKRRGADLRKVHSAPAPTKRTGSPPQNRAEAGRQIPARAHPEPTIPRGPREAADSLTLLLGNKGALISRGTGDELVARLEDMGDRADGWWLRVFSAGHQVMIAMAPFTRDGSGDATATCLVPNRRPESLVVDVVIDPLETPSTGNVAAFRRAVATGQRAAAAERVGQVTMARALWMECAAWHRQAGDELRSKQATAAARRTGLWPRAGRLQALSVPLDYSMIGVS